MCGLTSAASSAQQDEDSTEDMQIVTGLQQSAQPWPASQVPLQEEAGQSPAAVPIITTPRASGTPKTNALTDTDMRESPTVPTQVERTPKIRTQAVDAPAALASTQPPTAAPALVQSPTLTRPHQPESHHPSVKASKGQPDAIARSASPLKNCAEQAVLEHNAAKQLLPDKADTDHPLMAAAQPQMPTKAPRPRTIQTKAGLPEVVDAPFEVAEQATTVHLHESLKQAETSDKPDTALHNW